MQRINVDTPFGEAFSIIFHALTKGKGDDFAAFGFTFFRQGDILHIDVRAHSDSATNKNIISKGHAHCIWTGQYYEVAACMDINTLLEHIETGEASTPAARRTFEEICKELAQTLGQGWKITGCCPRFADFTNGDVDITLFDDGNINMNNEIFSAKQMAAIAAACQEIAANYAADQGKEDA